MKNNINQNYLTEKELGKILKHIFSNHPFIHNKQVPNSNIKTRPDYRNDILKLIVEFDGYHHYSTTKTIIRDELKDNTYKKMGYTIIRIPYFVQISKLIISNLFNIKTNFIQTYPHGFIDLKAMLPADYCELGIKHFENDIKNFYYIKNEIIFSLKNKIKEHKNIKLVLPPSLYYLVQ